MKVLPKPCLVAVALLIACPAFADDARGFYAGATVGATLFDLDQDALDASIVAAFAAGGLTVSNGHSQVNDNDASLGILVGYRFLPYLAVEGEYLSLGTAQYDATVDVSDGVTTIPARIHEDIDSTGFALSALGIWPVSRAWDLYARVGAYLADTTLTARLSGQGEKSSAHDSNTTTEYLFGIGAGFKPSPQWTVRFDYQRFVDVGENAAEFTVDRLSLQWLYKF